MSFEGPDRIAPGYRPEIDGLRAVAVLAVMAYHADFAWAGGGYVGVDVFFVISGYLITGIILREMEAGAFSLARFWERRARRILPALFLLLAACVLPALILLPPAQLERFGASLGAAIPFAANIYFWRSTGGYFDPRLGDVPLLHLWSLSVEEQFYLLYPLALLLAARYGRAWLPWLIVAGVAASLALNQALAGHERAAFFLLPTRAWELLAGAALVFFERRRRGPAFGSKMLAEAAAIMGLGLILGATFLYDRNFRYPGFWALLPVSGTMLLIVFATPAIRTGRLLAARALVAIGLISYSAYLWHLPLLVFGQALSLSALTAAERLALLLASLAIAYAAWRFVEVPFRRRDHFSRRFVVVLFAGAGSLLAAAGLLIWSSGGLPHRIPAPLQHVGRAWQSEVDWMLRCDSADSIPRAPEQGCTWGREGPVRFAVMGDSHAATLFPAIGRLAAERGSRTILLAAYGCAPGLPEASSPGSRNCLAYQERALAFLAARPEISTIILHARWTARLEQSYFDNGEGGVEPASLGAPPATAAARDAMARGLRALVLRLLAAGKRIILVYPVPEAGWDVPTHLARAHLLHADSARPLSTSHRRFVERNRQAYGMLDGIGTRPNLVRLHPERGLCDTIAPGRCLLTLDGRPLYFDANHLTPLGVRLALPGLAGALSAASPAR